VRGARACRHAEELEKVLQVMQTLRVSQPVAETLLESHQGDLVASVEAALDGMHG
jgi:hypothetical protein